MPIVANMTDYAVKRAMTDGVGAAWTDDEKQVACQRMGAEQADWDIVFDTTLTEDKTEITINMEKSYKHFRIYGKLKGNTQSWAYVNLPDSSASYFALIQNNTIYALLDIDILYGLYITDMSYGLDSQGLTNIRKQARFYAGNNEGTNRINISCPGGILSGSIIKVFAR